MNPITGDIVRKVRDAVADQHRAKAANERLRVALERIRQWDFDIAGDCVADAQAVAAAALKENCR